MKKSVYSLVLMDEVVEAIDALAYSMNTSRSNLINQILAEKVALVTPERHMQDIFNKMEKILDGYSNFQIQSQASDTMISIRSVLRYKYNPTIRYAVNLYRGKQEEIGEVKVISRTQSGGLYGFLEDFFEMWIQIERQYQENRWIVEQGAKWSRQLRLKQTNKYSPEELACAISDYIKMLDEGLKIYFTHHANRTLMSDYLNEHYKTEYLKLKIKL